jgi:hypothetical protein
MPIYNGWILRALAARLRQPGMQTQRRFMVVVSFLLALFVVGALFHLFRQPTEDALERAAIQVFAAFGILIAVMIAAAVVVRKRTGANWPNEEAFKLVGRQSEEQHPKER